MATERKESYSGIDVSMLEAEGMKLTRSQCVNCIYKTGFSTCKIFGEKPDMYARVSANVPCPERKVE